MGDFEDRLAAGYRKRTAPGTANAPLDGNDADPETGTGPLHTSEYVMAEDIMAGQINRQPITPTGKRLWEGPSNSMDAIMVEKDDILAIEREAREPAERALAEEAKCHDADRAIANQLAEALKNLGPLDKYGSGWEEARHALAAYEEARRG